MLIFSSLVVGCLLFLGDCLFWSYIACFYCGGVLVFSSGLLLILLGVRSIYFFLVFRGDGLQLLAVNDTCIIINDKALGLICF